MASSDVEILVKEMETWEIKEFLDMNRESGHFYEQEDVIRQVRENLDSGLLVAVRRDTGKVIGTCCVFQQSETIGEILALTAEGSGNRVRVFNELLTWGMCCLSDKTQLVLVEVPSSLHPLVTGKLRTKLSNIKSYTANIENLTPATVHDTGSYELKTIDYNTKRDILIDGTGIVVAIKSPLLHEEISYEVCVGNTTVGYGIMFQSDVDKWVIGPIYVSNQNAGKYIMRSMLLAAKDKGLTGDIITYIYDNNQEAESFLIDSGFQQSNEWGVYGVDRSSRPIEPQNALPLMRMIERTVFSIGAVFYPVLQRH